MSYLPPDDDVDDELPPYRLLTSQERDRILKIRERELALQERALRIRYRQSGYGRVLLLLILLLLIVGAAVIVINNPAVLDSILPARQTSTAQAMALQATAQAVEVMRQLNAQQATQIALYLAGTQAALQGNWAALDQTATQAALGFASTQAAIAQANAQQQATQIALNLMGTQAALGAQQSALNQTATQAALAFPTAVSPGVVIFATATPAPLAIQSPGWIDDAFAAGINADVWGFDPHGWAVAGSTLVALHDDAWLLSRRADFTNYALEVWFTPPPAGSALASDRTYHVLLNAQDALSLSGSVSATLRDSGSAITGAQLDFFAHSSAATDRFFLAAEPVPGSQAAGLQIPPPAGGAGYHVRVEVRSNRFTVFVEGQVVIDMQPFNAATGGAVGLAVAPETRIHRVRVSALQ